MKWLNYHHLHYFWMAARLKSVSAAAEELRLARPTVSTQIHTLEKTIGRQLFERAGKYLRLTDSGRIAYRYANDIFSLGEEMMNTLDGRPEGDIVRLRVGVADVLPKPIAAEFLAPALRSEKTRAICFEGKPATLLAQLAVHELDLVLADYPMSPEYDLRAHNHLLGECGLSIFAAPRLARRHRQGFPRSLHGAPFLLPTSNTAQRRSLDQWFLRRKRLPHVIAEFEDSELLKQFGQQGLGLFAVPAIIEQHTAQHYQVELVGRLEEVIERFYAISPERKITNPAVAMIIESVGRAKKIR